MDKKSGKKASRVKGVPKLEDANEAGTKNALKCTLILTEGKFEALYLSASFTLRFVFQSKNSIYAKENSMQCTGDSAKALAVSGLGVVGRDYYGVFPLKGKLLNTREATGKQMTENQEINSLLRIVGLQYRKKYDNEEDLKTLRYGKIMIMADQVRFQFQTCLFSQTSSLK